MAGKPIPLAHRFWIKVRKTATCWRWIASVDKDGYGQIGNDQTPRTMLKAHRLSWELKHGPIQQGSLVLHKCDHPWCVRPSHLYLGTHQNNMDDMNRRGRNIFQKKNPSLKLTSAQVDEIRRRRASGALLRVLAEEFHVAESMVCRIARGTRRAGVR